MRPAIALITCEEYPALAQDDRIFASALSESADVVPVVWTRDDIPPNVAAAVLRSAWDSHLHPGNFLAWLRRNAGRAPLFNPLALVEWNFHKRYLLELAALDVSVIPTVLFERGSAPPVAAAISNWRADSVVVKPAISASAYLTRRFRVSEEFRELRNFVDQLVRERDVLVQPLRPEVFTSQERSAVYIAGTLTHAAKRLAFGTRTPERDRREAALVLSRAELLFCESVLQALPAEPLYARVDYVVDARTGPLLMEVELIDPSLFFQHHPAAAQRLADELLRVPRVRGEQPHRAAPPLSRRY